jgi:ADP-ribosyl-[dinitrogen reductase] hydrolase
MTCQAPLVLETCRLFAYLAHCALSGNTLERIVRPSLAAMPGPALRREVAALVTQPMTAAPAPGRAGAGSDVLSALSAARWALGSTSSFRAAVLAAVNLGGNADVIGACCGLLAGAHYGVRAIPDTWLRALAQRQQIAEFADQLLTVALVDIGESRGSPR